MVTSSDSALLLRFHLSLPTTTQLAQHLCMISIFNMKILALLPLTFAAGAYTHAIDALQAEFLNLTTFPKDIDIETFYANYREKPNEVICETSDASPLYWHVSWLIDNLASETESNLCFSAKVVMSSVCGDTLRKWSGKGKSDGGAAFQLCRTDMSGASRNVCYPSPFLIVTLADRFCGARGAYLAPSSASARRPAAGTTPLSFPCTSA